MNRQQLWEYFGDNGVVDVALMHHKFGFTLNLEPTSLPVNVLEQRGKFIQEELNEFFEALKEGDELKMVDALIDIVVVAKGTAVMMGMQWQEHWDEVHRANMQKQRGKNPNRPDQDEDLIKPKGWKPPDHSKLWNPRLGR